MYTNSEPDRLKKGEDFTFPYENSFFTKERIETLTNTNVIIMIFKMIVTKKKIALASG